MSTEKKKVHFRVAINKNDREKREARERSGLRTGTKKAVPKEGNYV